jgi:SAM-dependent methyltransferase
VRTMSIFEWIEENLEPRRCDSVEILYDAMESQSGGSLPIIYQPFDGSRRAHWRDRGAMLDFLLATRGQGGRLLDFGPGDGWPSLIVAPYAAEVVGVDASRRRVEACTRNAGRLGIDNARFVHIPAGGPLPFEDETFDGAMAASSVEQTPDPRAALSEFYRVLKPGGRLRLTYEDLDRYGGSSRFDTWVWSLGPKGSRLVLYDRHIEEEYAVMYGVTFSATPEDVGLPMDRTGTLPFDRITPDVLARASDYITDALVCRLVHASGHTYFRWLNETGFSDIIPSHSGAWFAGEVFDRIPEGRRPRDMDSIDIMLKPAVAVVVEMRAPLDSNPDMTAVK